MGTALPIRPLVPGGELTVTEHFIRESLSFRRECGVHLAAVDQQWRRRRRLVFL